MKLTVAAVGRLRPALFAPAAEEYLGRIKRYATTQVVEIREVHERSMVEAQPLESKALLEATRSCNFRIALDSRGEMVRRAGSRQQAFWFRSYSGSSLIQVWALA